MENGNQSSTIQAPQIPHPMNQACNIEPVVSFSLS